MYELIERKRLDSSASSIVFSSIPQIYSDLVVMCSVKSTNTSDAWTDIQLRPNGATTGFSGRSLFGYGTTRSSNTDTNPSAGQQAAIGSNIFSSSSVYITNYTSSTSKSWSVDSTTESNDSASSIRWLGAYSWSGTAPITSLTLQSIQHSFDQNSTFTLYGVNRTSGIGRAPLAMGGYMSYSNGYWVHTFPSSGSFIPFTNMDVEYLVIAGGGGGSLGGGGAGGYRSSVIGELSGANSAAESTLSLTANTNYTVTVGAGGTGSSSQATNGSNSVFSTITATGGGGGAGLAAAGNGGSGGGAADFGRGGRIGTGTSGQGNNGGQGTTDGSTWTSGGGGGGASQIGATTTTSAGGKGGDGLLSSITGSPVFRAGGGGGGAQLSGAAAGAGGTGGGGNGGFFTGGAAGPGTAGTANTGGGAGGGTGNGVSGGSGIVIVRYRA